MGNSLTRGLILGLALAASAPAASYGIKGCVHDASGAPVAAAMVAIDVNRTEPVATDAKGCYQFRDIYEGVHKIIISKDNKVLAAEQIEVGGSKSVVTLDFTLHPSTETSAEGPVMLSLSKLKAQELRADPPPPRRPAPLAKPAITVASFAIAPERVIGGESTSAILTLTGPAPAGGVQLRFGANLDQVLSSELKFTVPEGATSATLTIPTKRYTGDKDFRVRLVLGGPHASDFVVESATRILVSKAGSGTGIVSSEPKRVECGGLCSVPFAAGTHVKLIAKPDADSVFTGWGGQCDAAGDVTVTSVMSCVATFQKRAADR